MNIEDNMLVIITEPKIIRFDLLKDVSKNLKHEIHSIIKHNEYLAENTIKHEIDQLLSKYKYGNNIHELAKQ